MERTKKLSERKVFEERLLLKSEGQQGGEEKRRESALYSP